MQEFYTLKKTTWFAHVFAALEASEIVARPLYCRDTIRNIYHFFLFDEKEHTLENAAA